MSATRRSGERNKKFRQFLHDRDDGTCQICFTSVSMEEFTIDHVIPKAHGGSDKIKNLQIAHDKCNNAKADTLPGANIVFIKKNIRTRQFIL